MAPRRRRPPPIDPENEASRRTTLPSYTSITIDHQSPSHFGIGASELASLVKEKDLTGLQKRGGVHRVATRLRSCVTYGTYEISGELDDLALRQNTYGVNTFQQSAKGFFHFLLEAFKDVTRLILLVCAGLSPGLAIKENRLKEGWYNGWSSFFSVFLMIVLSAMSKYQQNRQNRQASDNIHIQVMRKGQEQPVSIFKIVVGDVVCLRNNDQVPADGLLLNQCSLWVDESSMTGKSGFVEKNEQNPFLFSGTRVIMGNARMLVTAVGMNTKEGEMMSLTSKDSSEQTPLQAQLNEFTSLISKVGLAVNFLVFVVLQIYYLTGKRKDAKQEFVPGQTIGDNVLNSVGGKIAATVTIVSAMIPEGLPIAVTISFAYSVKCMMKHRVMVRKLSACETMGSVTTICTDKTSLTMNLIKVKFYACPAPPDKNSLGSKFVLNLIKDGIALNTTGSIFKPSSGSKYKFSGSPTKQVILSWAVRRLGMDMEETKKNYEVIQIKAFDLQKKRSGVLIKNCRDSTVHVHWKGAPEVVLAMCSSFYDEQGIERDLDGIDRSRYEQIIERMTANRLRCIAFAHKQVSEKEIKEREDGKKIQEDGMAFLGFFAIGDPCYPDTKSKIQKIRSFCQDFGVNIKTMTGDNIFTAEAITKNLGILGSELMVKCLKEKGDVVAVIGNGMNDALALKEANIGLLMGKQSSEVAKESSDIVILDNKIDSVALVLRWGRCIHDNIRKFIQFKLTVNMAALLINFVAAVSSGDVSLTAVQLLWVNLMVDTLGAFALSIEQPTGKLMKKPRVDGKEPIITKVMWRNVMGQAIYRVAVLLTIQFKGELIFGMDEAVKRTLIFNAFVLCQVFGLLNAKELKKKNVFNCIKKNKLFLGIIFVMVVLQVVMVEFLKWFAVTERLSWGQWGACVGIAAASWPIGWVVKCIPVPDAPIFQRIREGLEPVMKFMPGE